MTKPVLCLLQNFHSYSKGRFRKPTYGVDLINRRNATYVRFVPYIEAAGLPMRFSECTSVICVGKDKKFPTDLEFVQSAVNDREWLAIVSFGKQADKALTDLNVEHLVLPHPVSFKWRRELIVDTTAKLSELAKQLQLVGSS